MEAEDVPQARHVVVCCICSLRLEKAVPVDVACRKEALDSLLSQLQLHYLVAHGAFAPRSTRGEKTQYDLTE